MTWRFWKRHEPKRMAGGLTLAGEEPRCARCWRDLTYRKSWLFKCVSPHGAHLGPPNHFCDHCRWADGPDAPSGFVWEREW